MPIRPEKYLAALATTVPRLDPEPLNTCLGNQPPPSLPMAESNPAPQQTTASQRPVSLVVRNTRKPRTKSLHTFIPRSNHYLLARSLIENDKPSNPPASQRKPRGPHKTAPSQFCREVPPPNYVISDFIWEFSQPDLDLQIHDVFAALKTYDPQTFSELIAGLE
ncbi:hypothetical protein BDM02DRAFT_3183989 [Thelephora ganbajun]|uniref:Uncharacterized protein n=1 Tax=Thelephora ganbajun TaxID=370292 RepID=A0ACB6ZQS5_THEGA|nr:hypothetical protein BDM02DRAFT_3183989 [Thelephora ganbajun]